MQYIKLVLTIGDDYQEALIAELMEMEFDAFEQQEGRLITYIPRERFSGVDRERIELLLAAYPDEGYIATEEVVADRNWNEEWERTIQPPEIGRFYVKPTWARGTPPPDAILLEIDPKMAFGTGYHETTRLMLRLLPDAVGAGDRVLDAGTGTGVLAIGAVKVGAESVWAFDIDEWSYQNATENALVNGVREQIDIARGSVETIPDEARYDAILANINRNAIVELLPELVGRLVTGGDLLLSGLLATDREHILRQEPLSDCTLKQQLRENNWIALHLTRS